MEHINTKKLVKDGTEAVVDALGEPFIIVVKTDPINEYAPDIMVTVMTADPLDAVVLAGRIVDLYKDRFKCDPVVELDPIVKRESLDK